MWVFLTRRLRTWLILAVVVPLGAAAARALADRLEASRGPSRLTSGLRTASDLADRRRRRR